MCTEPYLVPAVEAAVGRVLGAAQAKHLATAHSLLMSDLLPHQAGEPVQVRCLCWLWEGRRGACGCRSVLGWSYV